jgi:hypothetical protein
MPCSTCSSRIIPFRDFYVQITGDIVDNILVFEDDAVDKIRKYFENKDIERDSEKLSYLVDINGCATQVQVPPKL